MILATTMQERSPKPRSERISFLSFFFKFFWIWSANLANYYLEGFIWRSAHLASYKASTKLLEIPFIEGNKSINCLKLF